MIPYFKPFLAGREVSYIQEALQGSLVGSGPFTQKAQNFLKNHTGTQKALLTNSCTGAMEMAALLFGVQPGDEVILPSFTFVSTANAFFLRGATPVFVDVRPDTLNIDASKIEQAITPRTKAIAVVHYAGVSCEMDTILDIAARHNLRVLEDAAQGVGCSYKGKALGTWGDLGAYSFHGTKNIVCGEGGALLINDPQFCEAAEVLWEKGTDRGRFLRGEVDKYTWQSVGGSFLPSDVTAAFLFAQLEEMETILQKRMNIWTFYHQQLQSLEEQGHIQRPTCPEACIHQGHIYYILLSDENAMLKLRDHLKNDQIQALGHYKPLHMSPMGQSFLKGSEDLQVTESIWNRLLRLPIGSGMSVEQAETVVESVKRFFQTSF